MPDALVLAAGGGVAKVVGQAGAHAPLAHAALLRVGPARVRLAGVAGQALGACRRGRCHISRLRNLGSRSSVFGFKSCIFLAQGLLEPPIG